MCGELDEAGLSRTAFLYGRGNGLHSVADSLWRFCLTLWSPRKDDGLGVHCSIVVTFCTLGVSPHRFRLFD